MIIPKIIIDLICGILNALGGYHWLFCRRYIMPFVISVETCLIEWQKKDKQWWEGLLILPVMGTLCLGYFFKKENNAWGRCLWFTLQALVIGTGCLLTGHIVWYFYIGYIIGSVVLGYIYKDWQQIIGDIVTGCYLGSIIFLIK